jgi:hypothetical protein
VSPPDLYGLPLDRFTAERNAHAKELKAAGKRDEAAVIAKLPKPSAAAWAVNQLVRSQRKRIDELVKRGDAMIAAQEKLLSGKADAKALRAAREAQQKALDPLVAAARKLGVSGASLERVAETLEAAALDSEAREQVLGGELVKELRREGFGLGGMELAAAAAPPPAKADPKREEARKAAKAELRRAHQAAARAAKALEAAQSRRDDAAQELEEAEAALIAARETAEQAVAGVRDAENRMP